MSKNIPTLNPAAALDFFLKSELHHGCELPGRIDYNKANYLQHITYQQTKKPASVLMMHVFATSSWVRSWLYGTLTG